MPRAKVKGSKRPKEDVVVFILRKILKKREVDSQKKLGEMVNADLKKVEPRYTISGSRIRKICLKASGIRVIIRTKKGKSRKKCPSCGHGLRRFYTKNLKGRKLVSGAKCPKCGYRASGGKWAPGRYSFSMR